MHIFKEQKQKQSIIKLNKQSTKKIQNLKIFKNFIKFKKISTKFKKNLNFKFPNKFKIYINFQN
jgi:hypothetical protein